MLRMKVALGQALVSHACNPSDSGGRDQEDRGSKLTGANISWDPISKRAGRVAQGAGPEFKAQNHKKKKKKVAFDSEIIRNH
jgi:hypothetical protein